MTNGYLINDLWCMQGSSDLWLVRAMVVSVCQALSSLDVGPANMESQYYAAPSRRVVKINFPELCDRRPRPRTDICYKDREGEGEHVVGHHHDVQFCSLYIVLLLPPQRGAWPAECCHYS